MASRQSRESDIRCESVYMYTYINKFIPVKTSCLSSDTLLKNDFYWTFNYLYDSLSKISCDRRAYWLTFIDDVILIISNFENDKFLSFLSLWNHICEWMELQIEDSKKYVRSSILMLQSYVLTTFLWIFVLEIIATQNDQKDAYVEKVKEN